jgi:glycosyltransferase involved in cell wall biosynthesis
VLLVRHSSRLEAHEDLTTKFSIIIPTYNRSNVIGEALDSVSAQTFQNYEVIVVDDGSTDDTCEALKPYADRIRYFKQLNKGPAAARNRGVVESRGEYIAFLDSDDLWYFDKLAQVAEAVQDHPEAGLFYSDFRLVNKLHNHSRIQRCKHIVGNAYYQLLLFNFIGTSTVVVKRGCFDICGLFCEALFGPEDWDLWIRIARKFPIVHIPATLVEHVQQSCGSVSASPEALEASRRVIERALAANPRLGRRQRAQIEARLCYKEGVRYLQRGKREESLAHFSDAIRSNPLFLRSYFYWGLVKIDIVDYLPDQVKLRLRIL